MFEALLFDLDGTLLNIDMNYFLPKYFGRMSSMALDHGYQGADRLAQQIWTSTEKMIANTDPDKTNEEVFLEDFYSNWPYPPGEFNRFFDAFYRDVFPQLNVFCQPFPGVQQMMENIFGRDLKIVIATNSVFPMTAIKSRLEWAGVGHFNYDLITSYENMHYCKPHPAYYQEICEVIGVKAENCLMVGNDAGEDLAAGQIGMKTFLVEDMLIDNGGGLKADWQGELQHLFHFLKNI